MNGFLPLTAADLGGSMDLSTPIGERISVGIEVSLLGMLVIFAVLGLIFAILCLFRVVFYDIPNRKKQDESTAYQPAPAPALKPAPKPKAKPEPTPVVSAPAADDSLIAAITAAVAAYMQAEGRAPGSFRVVSFRKR